MAEFPAELLARPLPFVALVGLDVVHNAVHRMIWHTFAVDRRPDRVPVNFQCLPGDHEYPKANPKKPTYDGYIPRGVLKRNWAKKHLQQVPAVLALFYDLDWEDQQWKERQMECASRVESMRAGLQGRNTRIALVLIQSRSTNPSGDDVVARERAAMLCNACKLSSNSLFLLPHADRLLGYIIRLESEFYELCQQYYQGESRTIKNRRDFLHKPTQLLLFVRHQFKIGFFSEIRQDFLSALRHYIQAYTFINEVKANEQNLLELKLVAGFINYKICKLCFQSGQPRDAIAQFRRHIDFYKDLMGYQLLAFEHYAWLSKQFSLFSELFDKAIETGLEAIQIQHPGFYYHQAAVFAKNQKDLFEVLCSSSAHKKTANFVTIQQPEYFGQRIWRIGLSDFEASSEEEQSEGIFLVQCQETRVDHSAIIVSLLGNAINQFKKHRSSRMRQSLLVQMANEYFSAGEFSKALTLFQRVMWEYRKEHWWQFLTPILTTALKCAYLIADWQQYVTVGLELAGKRELGSTGNYIQRPTYCFSSSTVEPIGIIDLERTRILTNLLRVISVNLCYFSIGCVHHVAPCLQNNPPEPEPGCEGIAVDEVQLWSQSVMKLAEETEPQQKGHNFFVIPMKEMAGFVQCKARFVDVETKADCPVVVLVHLRSTASFPVRFSKLSIFFNNELYNQHCVITGEQNVTQDSSGNLSGSTDLYLMPGKVSTYKMTFAALPENVNKMIEITSITLELGSLSSGRCAVLSWEGGGGDAGFEPLSVEKDDWESIIIQPRIQITPRDPLVELELQHKQPAIVGEFYTVRAVLRVMEDVPVQGVRWLLGMKESSSEAVQGTYICVDKPDPNPEKKLKYVTIDVGSLNPGEEREQMLFLKASYSGMKTVAARVFYNINVNVKPMDQLVTCACMKETFSSVQIVTPFDVSLKLTTLKFETIEKIHAGEPFLIISDVLCTSPWPVCIVTSRFDVFAPVESFDGTMVSQIEEVTLQNGDVASECHCLLVPCTSNVPKAAAVGQYIIEWTRSDAVSDDLKVTMCLSLPTIVIETVPFWIDTDLPAYGSVSSPLPARYTFYNRTNKVQEMEVVLDASDACLWSGYKQLNFRVLPHGSHSLTFNLLPLSSGDISLPRLKLNLPLYAGPSIDALVDQMVPSSIYVKPFNKAASSLATT